MSDPAKSSLPKPRQRLVELMQSINFGRIEHLSVRNGQPVLDTPPRVIRDIKIGGDNGPRQERKSANFVLKEQVIELFQHLDQLHNGTVEVLEVKYGLPFHLRIVETVA